MESVSSRIRSLFGIPNIDKHSQNQIESHGGVNIIVTEPDQHSRCVQNCRIPHSGEMNNRISNFKTWKYYYYFLNVLNSSKRQTSIQGISIYIQ